MKYVDSMVTFSEFPDEISLCVNIAGCPNHCPECHSKYLWKDEGETLNKESLFALIDKNPGITCVGLLGGDQAVNSILWLARCVKEHYPQLKVGWYSGKESAPLELLHDFDYVKVGPYRSEKGPLNKKTTNQIMYKREGDYWLDVTYKFWK